jgi:hypothetical protein
MDWIAVADDRGRWRAPANTLKSFGFHKMLQNSGIAAKVAASPEELKSMGLL